MDLLVKNIGKLCQVRDASISKVSGKDMAILPCIENAYLSVSNGLIADFGTMSNCPSEAQALRVIDATKRLVLPTWCDSHTHIVFAGSREGEFVHRIQGKSYEEIAQEGGGILNSARRLQASSEDELTEAALARLREMSLMGTGAVEIKSGYGLSVDSELKMLRVVRRLKSLSPLQIKATFLGAHAIPLEYQKDRKVYLQLIIDEMLPQIAQEGLADFIDVFCDKGFFTVEETANLLEAGAKYGLRPKIHANELDYSGGIQVGVQYKALSVDHLEYTGDAEIAALKNSETMPTLLPTTAFFLGLPYAPARKMIGADLPLALASDYNPGSSPSGNMPFVISLACIKMKMLPEEAINASTINSSYAMQVGEKLGSITRGKKASFFITHPMPSLAYLPYMFGNNPVEKVFINGEEPHF